MSGTVLSFAGLPTVDLKSERKKINLEVRRERLKSADTDKESRLDALLDAATGELIGTLPCDRMHVSFGEVMDFMTEQFAAAALPFKLKDSVVNPKRAELYQTYVFDRDITGPDGSKLVPMFILRSSYLRKLLDGKFGTYRFVCMNGVTVGQTIAGISVGANQAAEMARLSLKNQLELSLDRFDRVSEGYARLGQRTLTDSLKELVEDEDVSRGIKKGVLETLTQQGFISLLDKEGKVRFSVLEEDGASGVYRVEQEGTAWDLMQASTNYLTFQSRSLSSMVRGYDTVSALFGV